MVPDPLEQLLRHLRQLDPLHRGGVKVERCEHYVEELVTKSHEDGGLVGEGFGVKADVGALVINQAGTVPTLEGTVVVRGFGGVPRTDLPLVQAELAAQPGEVRADNSLDGASVQVITS